MNRCRSLELVSEYFSGVYCGSDGLRVSSLHMHAKVSKVEVAQEVEKRKKKNIYIYKANPGMLLNQ